MKRTLRIKAFYRFLFQLITAFLLLVKGHEARAQGKLVLNGGAVVLQNNAALVIDNAANDAITRTGSGYISSESAGNKVIWAIGNGNAGVYTIPFGTAGNYFPVSFKAASGTGTTGSYIFSTFPTVPVNSGELPPGVTNMTISTGDNSLKTVDRFWQLKPQGYSSAPTLSDLSFVYPAAALAAPNDIAEANLAAFRWNDVLQKWNDYTPVSAVNTTDNTVTVSSIPGNQQFDWWTLADVGTPLPVTLLDFIARPVNGQVLANWQTVMEANTDHFELWRSADSHSFDFVESVAAAGNSNALLNYSTVDPKPYSGISYYQLKSVDLDARFTWSSVVRVDLGVPQRLSIYPSPATTQITVLSSAEILAGNPVVSLYDSRGQRLNQFLLKTISQPIDISTLPAGVYQLIVDYANQTKILRFVKQ